MDEKVEKSISTPDEVLDAIEVAKKHPQVYRVSTPGYDNDVDAISVDIVFAVNLANQFKVQGHSPNGINQNEEVRFVFPRTYPLQAPIISLRSDFPRNHPHFQYWLFKNERPVPCIYDGNISELLQADGIRGILNQVALWLDKAAAGHLIDPIQGWESARRDELEHLVIASADDIRHLVKAEEGCRYLSFSYLAFDSITEKLIIRGQVKEPVTPNPANFPGLVSRSSRPEFISGNSIALVIWPRKSDSCGEIVNDTYEPDCVTNIDQLFSKAKSFGCEKSLKTQLDWIHVCKKNSNSNITAPLVIILCVRRPFHLIGTDSSIELYFYITNIDATPESGKIRVEPAAHANSIDASLLKQMSDDGKGQTPNWILAGCGSLGSKIALHLGRGGRAPNCVIDKSIMHPHNAARHALIPGTDRLQILWSQSKAILLANAMRSLGQKTTPLTINLIEALRSNSVLRKIRFNEAWSFVNATASLAVREACASLSPTDFPTRIIEASLYSKGNIGIISFEGPERNPNTSDLISEAYCFIKDLPQASAMFFNTKSALQRTPIGEGCGSFTMRMSDSRLSMFAAGMAESIAQRQRLGLNPKEGELLIGFLSENKLGVIWNEFRCPPVHKIKAENTKSWRIHIHQRAIDKILAEVEKWHGSETGGIIVGRLSETTRTIHVIDILPAPEDSYRSRTEFVLGTKGIKNLLQRYGESTGWTLYCLGTWHSHLSPSGPSEIDKKTTQTLALARLAPSALLIYTPSGFRCLLAKNSHSRSI